MPDGHRKYILQISRLARVPNTRSNSKYVLQMLGSQLLVAKTKNKGHACRISLKFKSEIVIEDRDNENENRSEDGFMLKHSC